MNINSNPEWNEKSDQEKRLTILGLIIAFIVLVLATLYISGIFTNSIVIFVPLMGLLMLVQSMLMWNNRRIVSVCCIVVAVFLFLCSILFVLRL